MCRAMNRKLSGILLGTGAGKKATGNGQQAVGGVIDRPQEEPTVGGGVPDAPQAAKTDTPVVDGSPSVGDGSPVPLSPAGAASQNCHSQRSEESVTPGAILAAAKKVMIVPGYGMALAQAQRLVKQLADKLEAKGCEVKFAIHPVAGRMPGHMNVLLCEVDVPYDQLYEMDDINDEFKDCDAAVIIGASDVVNPAANTAEGTPIYGMPVLRAEEAKHIIVCNYDDKPGYAGVPNPLYTQANTLMLLGDAKDSLKELLNSF
ncbi:MAG: NAD(P)(+) transhydrogenase (Re/Si-specific) subunit beta [Oscillospiraceae bacterium]|nr:NAD(P)(+) transhydrogenase (Re/Si-specific) subunit beta [Oscillospiraceae bacterium]